jgi:D-amino peptidase
MPPVKVYISVDMEGVAGVVHTEQCLRGKHGYDEAAELMTLEANAAALGAFDAGAIEVLLNDSHGDMRNLRLAQLDPRVQILSGNLKQFSMAEGVEGGHFDVALFVGYHGGAGTQNSILDHTYSSRVISGVRVNGRTLNETGLNALVAGQAGTPVGLVTGDDNACRQCVEVLGDVDTVVVKWAVGRLAARSLHPEQARARIREGARNAVAGRERFRPFTLDAPYRLEVDLLTTAMGDAASLIPGTTRPAPRTVTFETSDVLTMFRALLAISRLGATAA